MTWFWTLARDRFWVIPMVCAMFAVVLGLALSSLDNLLGTSFSVPFLFTGGPEGARALLSAITTSMISFTGLVFSITVVVLQLTSSQFSPRVLSTFLRDRFNQLALGVFIATFVYSLVVLRAVRGTAESDPYVPQLAVTAAFGFVLASVAVFLGYINHIAQAIRAATIITKIGQDTTELLERRFRPDARPAAELPLPVGEGRCVPSQRPGVVQQVDDEALEGLAEASGTTICVVPAVGEFVPAGVPLFEVFGADPPDDSRLRNAIQLGTERSLDQDVGFGLRQLVDIAERALSAGVNDPTTAVQVLDQLHEILRRLATRALRPRQRKTDDGWLAVNVPQPSFSDYLTLGVAEIARCGQGNPRIQRRLHVLLTDLQDVALPEHGATIARLLAAQDATASGEAGTDPGASDVGLR